MAVYEFECNACGNHFEVSIPISEHDRLRKRPPKCPQCGKSQVQQLASSFSTKAPSKY
jgi:putative FmdB family regulatory protein